jgi:hypothetical protein
VAGGLDAGKYFWRTGREKCFSLDIPFYRTSCLLVTRDLGCPWILLWALGQESAT